MVNPEEKELHVFDDGSDAFVAADLADAEAARREFYGESLADVEAMRRELGDSAADFRAVPDDREIGIRREDPVAGFDCACLVDEHVRGCPVGWPVKSARAWASENGRGLLYTREV